MAHKFFCGSILILSFPDLQGQVYRQPCRKAITKPNEDIAGKEAEATILQPRPQCQGDPLHEVLHAGHRNAIPKGFVA